jgi:hypothetical protein
VVNYKDYFTIPDLDKPELKIEYSFDNIQSSEVGTATAPFLRTLTVCTVRVIIYWHVFNNSNPKG